MRIVRRLLILLGLVVSSLAACHLALAEHLQAGSPFENQSLGSVLGDCKLTIHPRAMYMRRTFQKDVPFVSQEACALGGWVEGKTSPWYGFSADLAGYTSQKIMCPSGKTSASLLSPDNSGYTVLGKAYLQWEGYQTRARAYRQEIKTPLLNSQDCRMTPVLFEAYTLENRGVTNLSLIASCVTTWKPYNYTRFVSLYKTTGVDKNDPVGLAGFIYAPTPQITVQAYEYLCFGLMNDSFAQFDYDVEIIEDVVFENSFQGCAQENIAATTLGSFNTAEGCYLAGLNWLGLNPNVGFSLTANNHRMVNPWEGWPFYTSIMEEDCNMAGQKAWLFDLTCDLDKFVGVTGVSFFLDETLSWTPSDGSPSGPAQREYNATLDYHLPGALHGLWLQLKAAYVDNSLSLEPHQNYTDFRAILNYEIAF